MDITLKHLHIENFKGVRNLDIDFSWDTTNIYGDNATGKTTLVDAFLWVLFGKDSQGRSDFQIRPMDADGNTVDNVEITVIATMDIDGTEVIFQKNQNQNWVKKRGSEAPTFQGNVNTFFVDTFPVSQKEYTEKVASIIDADLFKLLTNPRTFASLKWQEQRNILLRFVSEVTDADVLALDPDKYDLIAADVQTAGAEKLKEKASMTLKKLREQQKQYPIRIDEAMNSITSEIDNGDALTERKAELEAELENFLADKAGELSATQAAASIRAQIMQAKSDMDAIAWKENEKAKSAYRQCKANYDRAVSDADQIANEILKLEESAKVIGKSIERTEQELKETRAKYDDIKAEKISEGEKTCPTCGRPFDEEQLADAVANFRARKRKRLEAIVETGGQLKEKLTELKDGLEKGEARRAKLKAEMAVKLDEAAALKAVFESTPAEADLSANEDYQNLVRTASELQARLSSMDNDENRKQAIKEQEQAIRANIRQVDEDLATLAANERAKARIEQLQSAQRECSQMVADQEQIVYLLEEFIKLKMTLLTDRINSHFKEVRFKLFEQLINGGVKETCVMQIASNGCFVDYLNANNAAQIQGGLDVINALSELYEVSAPIFIDNREGVVTIPAIDAQIINLYVNPLDKVLRIEKYE